MANKALDWDEQSHRIGFEGLDVLADFSPQWHHIFPKTYLEGNVKAELVDALGNIAVIAPSINIRISARRRLTMCLATKSGFASMKSKSCEQKEHRVIAPTYLTAKGRSDAQIQLISGHESKKSLEVYQHLSLESVDKAYQDAVQSVGI